VWVSKFPDLATKVLQSDLKNGNIASDCEQTCIHSHSVAASRPLFDVLFLAWLGDLLSSLHDVSWISVGYHFIHVMSHGYICDKVRSLKKALY
jgi:hypothetical protein